jgi:hypothetical protein
MFMAIMNQMNPYEPPESEARERQNLPSLWNRTTPVQKAVLTFGVLKAAELISKFISWMWPV